MRGLLWFLALFCVAVVVALFAGSNHNTLTLFWDPYRIDVSINLALAALVALFLVLHFAFAAAGAVLRIPQQARRWRLAQRERAMVGALLEALNLLISGRFVRARKSAERVLEVHEALEHGGEALPYGRKLRAMAHLVAAESAHAVQDRTHREAHYAQALECSQGREGLDTLDGVRLRGARWSFDDRQAQQVLERLNQLPLGTARRTLALRLRFKAARLSGNAKLALETARQLTKHRAFSELAGASIARGLAIELLNSAHDAVQVQRAWDELDPSEQLLPEVVLQAAVRLIDCGGSAALALAWLMPVWTVAIDPDRGIPLQQRVQLVRVLEKVFMQGEGALDTDWLRRLEQAQVSQPAEMLWTYLGGVACMRMQLWGKAQQLLRQSVHALADVELRRSAWRSLGQMAEERNDTAAALAAYREAAKS